MSSCVAVPDLFRLSPCRVSLCPQGCQLKYAEVLFHEMPSPGVRDYCAMLTLYRTFHRWRDAEHIYHKMVTHIAQGTHTGRRVAHWQTVVWRVRGGGVRVCTDAHTCALCFCLRLACAEPLYDGPVSSLWQGQDAPKAIPQAEGEHSHEPLDVTLAIMQYMVRSGPFSLSRKGCFRLWHGLVGRMCWFIALGRRGC